MNMTTVKNKLRTQTNQVYKHFTGEDTDSWHKAVTTKQENRKNYNKRK